MTFRITMSTISIICLGILLYFSWGAPNYLGYISAGLIGYSIAIWTSATSENHKIDPNVIQTTLNDIPAHDQKRILNALDGRRKIEAIKFWRAATGDGLSESKAIIESLLKQRV